MCFDPYNPLGYDDTERYFEKESECMPDVGYCSNRYNKCMRQEALDVIIETIRLNEKVDPFVPYLAMSYYDCYLSRNGLLKIVIKDKMTENNELLAICCLSLAYKTTLSVDKKALDLKTSNKNTSSEMMIHQTLSKRPKNVKYLLLGWERKRGEKVIEDGLKGRMKSITALCFIGYFLKVCNRQHETSEERQSITRIILETQSDIRFCYYKPSIIAASAVTVFLSYQAPEYSQTYEENIMRSRCFDKNCLELVKETWAKNAKRKLKADYGLGTHMKKVTLQGEGKGFHSSIDYELQWMTTVEIAELSDKYFNPYDPSGLEDIDDYLNKEQEFMADGGYSENPNNKRLRQVALHVISDTIRISGKVDAFVPYLAVTYLDYYISRRGLDLRDTVMENMELLAVSCLLLAFETTYSCDFWGEDKNSEKIRQYMIQRPRNVKYLLSSNDGGGCLNINYLFDIPEKPVTALCFINYFLNKCKPRREAPKERETITQIILELQSDIRLCTFKPSIISASAVTAFMSHQAPEYCQTYEDNIMRLKCIDQDEFKTCLAFVKRTYAKMKIGANTETKMQRLQDDGKGFLVTIDYKPEWMTAPEIISLNDMYFDPYDPRGFEDIGRYLDNEWKYMVLDGYSNNVDNERMRQVALHAIIETIKFGGKVDAFVPYLAMNYYDRYVSKKDLLNKKPTMMEDIELLAIRCLSLAFETTLSYGYWRDNQSSEKIRQYLLKRPRNVNYFQGSDSRGAEDMIKDSLLLKEPITALCFIKYFLKECEALEEKEQITRIILETQDDIRLCGHQPSIIAASAVVVFLSDRSPEYSQIYEEKVMRLLGYIDKNKLKDCLALMKEKYDKKNLRADIGMKKLSLQGGENGFNVSIDYQLQWIVTDGIEEILKTLGTGTRVSIQLANSYGRMMRQYEEIQIFLSEIENAETAENVETLSGMLENLGKLSQRLEEVIIKNAPVLHQRSTVMD